VISRRAMSLTAVGVHVYAGGFTLGVSKHFDVLAVFEDSGYGVSTHLANFPEVPVHVGLPWTVDGLQPDLVYSNPPCAIFSPVGVSMRGGSHAWRTDPRVSCWYDCFDLAERLRPRVFALESVPQAYVRGRELVDDLTRRALSLGYSVTHLLVNAAYLGAPQARRRFFFIAHDVSVFAPGIRAVAPNWSPPPTAGEVLDAVEDPGPWTVSDKPPPELIARTLPGHGLRETWEHLNPNYEETRSDRGTIPGRPMIMEYRVNPDAPFGAWVQDTVYHHRELRKLGENEMRALCGFPLDFKLLGRNPGENGSLLARGVLPSVAEWLARAATAALEGSKGDWSDRAVWCHDMRKPDVDPVNLTELYIDDTVTTVGFDDTASDTGLLPEGPRARIPRVELLDKHVPYDPEQMTGFEDPKVLSGAPETAGIACTEAVTAGETATLTDLRGGDTCQSGATAGETAFTTPVGDTFAVRDVENLPKPVNGEKSGEFIKRLLCDTDLDAGEVVVAVHRSYLGRKTRVSDVYFNYRALLKSGTTVRPWPRVGAQQVDAQQVSAQQVSAQQVDAQRVDAQQVDAQQVGAVMSARCVVTGTPRRVAIVEWFPRCCGATDFGAHLSTARPGLELVSVSASGRPLKSWNTPWTWRTLPLSEAARIINDEYDAVVLTDVACLGLRPQSDGSPPWYAGVLSEVRVPTTAVFHGGMNVKSGHDSAIDALFSSPGFCGSVVTVRSEQAKTRLSRWTPRIVVNPFLPYREDRASGVDPDRARTREVISTARLMTNKGQQAFLTVVDALSGNVNAWGYNSSGRSASVAWMLYEAGLALGLRAEREPLVDPRFAHLKNPLSNRFHTGKFTLTTPSGRSFAYHGGYSKLSDVDWSPWLHVSLFNASFHGLLEYTVLDAVHAGCVVAVPEGTVAPGTYDGLVELPYRSSTMSMSTGEVKCDFDNAGVVTVINRVLNLTDDKLRELQARQLRSVRARHGSASVWRSVEVALKGVQ
jgi:site-specific DNA-cytosine methylase